MNVHEMLMAHRYLDVTLACRTTLEKDPNDISAIEGMARAYRAEGEYTESLSYFERLAALRKGSTVTESVAPGSFPWTIDIACLYLVSGNKPKAIQLMRDLASGVLDGS